MTKPGETVNREDVVSPTGGEKHIELAPIHDFAGKMRQQEIRNFVCLCSHTECIDRSLARRISKHPFESDIVGSHYKLADCKVGYV